MMNDVELQCINGCGELITTLYEGFEIKTCNECGGVWLRHKTLQNIITTEEETWSDTEREEVLKETGKSGVPLDEVIRVRNCPECKKPLQSVNYQYSSGIIVDQCQLHGIWLDEGELDRIQIYMEHWNNKNKK